MNEERTTSSVLEVRGLSKRFGGMQAVDNVSFRAESGEIVGLVGPNGAGKSTLMHIMAGIVRPDKGEILIDHSPVVIKGPRDSRRLGIEIVYQNLALIDTLDIASNIHLGRELFRPPTIFQWLDDAKMQAEARELLTGLALDLDPKQLVGLLSGGQRQAVALGRAIFHQARFAIFDEPTAALGVIETRATLKTMKGFRDRGVGVIVVSHALEDVFSITDRIITMRAGRVVGERATKMTSPEEILELMMMGDTSGEFPTMSV